MDETDDLMDNEVMDETQELERGNLCLKNWN